MSTFSCNNVDTTCTFDLMTEYNDPQTTLQCSSPTAVINSMQIGTTNTSTSGHLGCIQNVTCSDGEVLSGVVASTACANHADTIQTVTCAGKGGFNGYAVYDDNGAVAGFQPVCADGSIPDGLPTFDNTGTHVGPAVCPDGFYFRSFSMGNGCNDSSCVTENSITCAPLTDFCVGDNLNKGECVSFCNSFPGHCDKELLKYCADPVNFTKPICGCALPSAQYPLLAIQNATGTTVPIACDVRCQAQDHINLASTGTCSVGTLCVQSNLDITAVQSTLGQGITVSQTCTTTTNNGTTTNVASSLTSGTTLYLLIGVILIVIIAIIVIIVIVASSSSKKKKQEAARKAAAAANGAPPPPR